MNDNDTGLVLPGAKFAGSNWLPSVISCVLEHCAFEPVKLFTLDIELSNVPGKTNNTINWALVEFEFTKTACLVVSKWLVLMDKNSVHVALAVSDKELWILRDHYHALLYTFLIGTTAHDLSELMEAYGRKTCFIGRNLSSYVCDKCVVICFVSKTSKSAAIGSVSVFKGVNLQWAGLSLANWVCLAGIYKKKLAPIFHLVSFTGKTWAQVVGGSNSRMALSSSFGSGLLSAMVPPLQFSLNVNNRFATLEHSLVSLAEQVDKLAKRLDAFRPTVSQHGPKCQPLITSSLQNQEMDTVINEVLGTAISDRTVVKIVVYDLSAVSKLEDTLDILSKTVMDLSTRLENAGLGSGSLSPQ
ncbi:hypothetical protein G9A89_017179 [Geosiphon pyriformis]|nr:hypothetical protein G9A89_017179 [Geosiphon pyriformis]